MSRPVKFYHNVMTIACTVEIGDRRICRDADEIVTIGRDGEHPFEQIAAGKKLPRMWQFIVPYRSLHKAYHKLTAPHEQPTN